MAETPQQGHRADVVDILTTDHREMMDLLRRIPDTPDPAERRDLADAVIAEVMRHAVAEEMYVYPAMEEHLPQGAEEVEHDKKEHDELVAVMKQLEDADSADQAFLDLVRQMTDMLSHHIEDEEAEQFPKLRTSIPADQLVDLGAKVDNAKKLAPTRPHPHAPQSELFHKTVGPGVGMADRLRDLLTSRNTN
ncbi:MAG: hemerythrin domain-containing protein [Citricoccus sp.]